jgi:ribosomal protein S27E
MSAEIHKIPVRGEPMPVNCETCGEWQILNAHWLVYDDGTFRCVTCGTAYEFVE